MFKEEAFCFSHMERRNWDYLGTWNKDIKKYLILETELARDILGFGLCSWIAFLL